VSGDLSALSALTRDAPRFSESYDHKVVAFEFMPRRAKLFWPPAASNVSGVIKRQMFGRGYRFQVIWIDARRLPTGVMDMQSIHFHRWI